MDETRYMFKVRMMAMRNISGRKYSYNFVCPLCDFESNTMLFETAQTVGVEHLMDEHTLKRKGDKLFGNCRECNLDDKL